LEAAIKHWFLKKDNMHRHTTHIKAYCRLTNTEIHCGQFRFQRSPETSVEVFLKEIYKKLGKDYPKFYKMDILCKAAWLAAELLQQEVPFAGTQTPLVWANHSGSSAADAAHAQHIYADEGSASPALFVYTLPNIAMGEISIRHQLHSENVFFIFETFDPRKTLPLEASYLLQESTSYVLGAWVEANADTLDVLMYVVGKEGNYPHSIAYLNAIYKEL
jgi:hypothetical protein